MTEDTDLTPPTKTKAAKAPKEPKPKKEKVVKAVPAATDEAGNPLPKKERAPRADYGYSPTSLIQIVKDKDNAYRGKRKEWFDKLVAAEGKSAATFLEENKGDDAPRGWLRFFVQDGTVTLLRQESLEQEAA